MAWKPSEYLKLYKLGHNDTEHVEITEDEGNIIIERWKANWPIETL